MIDTEVFQYEYGIYTCTDKEYFPGVVASLKSLRLHGYEGPFAVGDWGLEPWQRAYLASHGAIVVSADWMRSLRYIDVLTDSNPRDSGYAFKPFFIHRARLFRRFTYIDADYLSLCNLQEHLEPMIKAGRFLAINERNHVQEWSKVHEEACGVKPGRYSYVNAGFFSISLDHHDFVIEEWRNMMTRQKLNHPFWYGDQGALNAVLDKYNVSKIDFGKKDLWNQSGLEGIGISGQYDIASLDPPILCSVREHEQIYGWHGTGGCRYWRFLGIHPEGADNHEEWQVWFNNWCENKVPDEVIDIFRHMLFYDNDLEIRDFSLVSR